MIEHKKYKLLEQGLKAVSSGTINLLILRGDAGVGKSYTTLQYLKEKKVNHIYLHSYSTPLSFYKHLYENRNRDVIIFDDLEGLEDKKIISMLKNCCWDADGKREVSYSSTSEKLSDYKLPQSFILKANIILICNALPQDFKAILNRSLFVNFKFSYEDKLLIFNDVMSDANIDQEVLDYVKEKCNGLTHNLSIRTLVILSKLKNAKNEWQSFAEELLFIDEDEQKLFNIIQSTQTIKEAEVLWCKETGKSRMSFYRLKKKFSNKKD